jgi:hypothetical protein
MMNRTLLISIVLIACDGNNEVDAGRDAGMDDAGMGELDAGSSDGGIDAGSTDQDAGPDAGMMDAGPRNMLGEPCTVNANCGEGTSPQCWPMFLGNNPDLIDVPDGYCSSRCGDDGDCGSGVCVNFGGTIGRWCLRDCTGGTECREGSTQYACVFGNAGTDYCLPETVFDCDPTLGEGACTTRGPSGDVPGGCVRAGHGAGLRGYCEPLCTIGEDTCEADGAMRARHCLVTDARWDDTGAATGDTFVGPRCVVTGISTAVADPIGTTCELGGENLLEICVDGAECYLQGAAPAGMGFDAMGDNICYALCYLPGGASATVCPSTTTCSDIWGLGARTDPMLRVGLCR